MKAATWGLAIATSLTAHLGAGALMAAMLQPDPVADQPPPTSQLRIETQEVAQSRASAQAPKSTAATADSAKGSAAAQGEVPQSVAKLEAPRQDKLAAVAPSAPAAQALAPAAEKLAQTAAPPTTQALAAPPPIKATDPRSEPAKAAAPQATPVAATAPDTPPLKPTTSATTLAATAPDTPPLKPITSATTLAATAPDTPPLKPTTSATTLAASAPDTPALAATPPDLQPAAAAPADGQHMTAALAWTGDTGRIDPQSLTAITSFMQPGDTKAQADPTHDALSAILTSVPCARLQAEFNPATGSLELRGHVPDPAMRAPLLKALQDQLGSAIKVTDAMLILPRPQCGALSGIADVGLPQSQDQNTNPRLIGADAQARAYDYTQGQTMVLDLAAPDYDAWLYVDFFDADGQVIHLVPNATVPLRLRPAKTAMRVGAADAGEPFLHITIGPPYGQEIAAAFAASAPLYAGLRPLSEPAAPYLDWLKTKVSAARAADPGFKGEWVYFFVSTTER